MTATMAPSRGQRCTVIGMLILLGAGFAYSGFASLRHYSALLQKPPALGPSATIDAYLSLVNISSGEELRQAANRIWSAHENIAFVAEPSTLSDRDIRQIFFSVSYLLYPRRVSLSSWCDPEASSSRCEMGRSPAKHVVFVGRANPFPHAHTQQISDVVSLIRLP